MSTQAKHLPPLQPDPGPAQRPLRRSRARGVARAVFLTILLGVGLAGLAIYSRPYWRQHRGLIERFPALEQSLSGAAVRLDAAEEKIRAWTGDRDAFEQRLQKLEERTRSQLHLARKQAQELAAQAHARLLGEMDRRTQALNIRLERVESGQQSGGAQLARLEQEIAALRRDVDQQVSLARNDAGRDVARLDQRVADLQLQNGRHGRELDSLAHVCAFLSLSVCN